MTNIGDLLNTLTAATVKSWVAFPRALEHMNLHPLRTDVAYNPDGRLDELIAAVQTAPDPILRSIQFTPVEGVPEGCLFLRVFWPDDFPMVGTRDAFSTLALIDLRVAAELFDKVVGPVRRVEPTHAAFDKVQ